MFTVHAIQANGRLTHKEHLNNDELDGWMQGALAKHKTVRVVQDLTGRVIVYQNDGSRWVAFHRVTVEPCHIAGL